MSRTAVTALAVAALAAGCGQARREETPIGIAPVPASASAPEPVPANRSGVGEGLDPDEAILMQAPLVRLDRRAGPAARGDTFDAELGSHRAVAEPALLVAPTAFRAPLAFYRLSRALGMRVVPVTVLRAVPLGELGTALGGARDKTAELAALRVQNDGTVDVLLSMRSSASAGSPWDAPPGAPAEVESLETATLDRWAASPAPAPGEDSAMLRDYLEMLVLDYLSANDARREVIRAPHAIVLGDNATAFPLRPERAVLDRLLRRLKAAARFPRGLRDALARLDRDRATAALNPGGFERWLVSPRVLVDLDERRAALLTLVEARVAERGTAAVLAL